MKKLLSILSVVALTSTASTSVIACGSQEKPTENNLSTIITIKNLDTIYISRKDTPTKMEILEAVQKKNPEIYKYNLTDNDFDFENGKITNESVTIVAVPESKFKGEVTLTYQCTSFKVMAGTSGSMRSITTVSNGTVYTGSYSGTIYKSNGSGDFEEVVNEKIEVDALTTDTLDNVYAANGTVYKKAASQEAFTKMVLSADAENVTNWLSLTTSKANNTVYAGSKDGKIFKTDLNGQLKTAMTGIDGQIKSLTSDKNGIIYAGSSNGRVYKNDGSDIIFQPLVGPTGSIESLTTSEANNTVYAGSDNGTVYKLTNGTTFTPMIGTSGTIESLTSDKDGNIYAGTVEGIIYKSKLGTDPFIVMTGKVDQIYSLAISNNGSMYIATTRGIYRY